MSGRGSVSKYSTANGLRWSFRFDGPARPDGRRRQVRRRGFRTHAEATAVLDRERARWAGVVDPSAIRLGDYLAGWINHRSAVGAIRPATADQYGDALKMLGEDLEVVAIMKLTASHLDRRYAELATTGGRSGDGRSASTIRKLHAVVRKGLSDAQRKGMIPMNVADAADPPSTSAARPAERKVWDAADGFALIRWPRLAADERCLVVLAMLGGLRRGEIAGLRWSDLGGDQLSIERTIAQAPDKTWVVGPPKSAKGRRVVTLPDEAITALEMYRREQISWFMATGHRPDTEPLLVSRRTLDPVTPEELSRWWQRIIARAVAAEVVPTAMTLHDGRHWCGTHLVAAGVDPRTVSEVLGHADPAFTLRVYAHSDDDRKRAAAAALGALG